jgi:phospholipase A-2-activating protein
MASSASSLNAEFHLWTQVFGHSGDVKCVTSTPDATVVTASRDGSVRRWRLGEDNVALQIAAHTTHTGFVNTVVALPDFLVSAGHDTSLVVWPNAPGADAVRVVTNAHSANICSLAPLVLRDGAVGLVSASWDHSAKLWRWTGSTFELLRTLAEAATVWAVLSLSESMLLTGSADKAIRLYDPATGRKLRQFDAHTDCVRALLAVPDVGFLSAANDARILLWTIDGAVLREFAGHSAYIYSLTALEPGRFASSGEDKLVHVWSIEAADPLQTLRVPGSAWSVAAYRHAPRAEHPNVSPASALVDLMCASSEGVVHVFSRDAVRQAPPELLGNFVSAVEEAFQPPKRGGDIDVSRYPTREDGLRAKGTRNGENRIVAHEGLAEVWSWSEAADEWQHLGYAEGTADGANDDSKMLDGVRYDFVFDVDIDAGNPLKLGYNHGQDPYTVAQQFIWKHQIDQGALPTIADFIVRNTGAKITANPMSIDPLTRGRALPDVLPVRDYVLFRSGAPEPIVAKLLELHGNATLSAADKALLQQLGAALAPNGGAATDAQVALLVNTLQWPTSVLFPALDLARLALARGVGGAPLRSAVATVLARVAQEMTSNVGSVSGALQLVAARTCGNWIAAVATSSETASEPVNFVSVARLVLQFVLPFRHVTSMSRNVALARASLLLNVAVLSLTHAFGDQVKASCWSEVQRAVASEADGDVQFSLLGALGTLLYRDTTLFRTADAGGVTSVVAKFDSSSYAPKVQSITQELLEMMTDLVR